MELLQAFIDYISYEKRFSKHTVQGYQSDLEQFFYFTRATYEIDTPVDVTRQVIRSWVIALMQSGQASTSVRRKISSLQSFYKFLLRKQILDHNPVKGIVLPKLPSKVPSFLRQSEADALIGESGATNDHSPYCIKLHQAIFAMLYLCGLRRAELIQIKLSDLDIRKRELSVFGKGSKQRIVPLADELVDILQVYLNGRTELEIVKDQERLFLTENGRALYPNYVYRVVKKGIRLNSTTTAASPHVLRHTFASHLSQNGADLNAIKSLLGHSSLASTQIYTHHSLDGLKRMYDAAHPKAKKGI